MAVAAAPTAAAATGQVDLPGCTPFSPAGAEGSSIVEPWRVVLDHDGAVSGHRMTLRRDGLDTTVHAGRRGFAVHARPGRVLLGERSATGTRLSMVDTDQGCIAWTRDVSDLAYAPEHPQGDELRMTLHEPDTRAYRGTIVLDIDTGATAAMIDDECTAACAPNDGEVPPSAFGPAGYARPVPAFAAGGWAGDKTLAYAWGAGDVPPDWAKGPLKSGAEDVGRTSDAGSPDFVYRSNASNAIRYTGTLPSFCGAAIACAGRNKPANWWGVWIKPHGSDFGWGTLRWCQKSQSDGCFDIRRVVLHELGHIVGLNHPESGGFRLGAHESVMHAITPAKSRPGGTRHAFGRCDVATLQELYDVPTNKMPISTCNDVVSKLALSASRGAVDAGQSVSLRAKLSIADRSAYGKLANNPLNQRSVKLKFRRVASGDDWTTAWMRFQQSGSYDLQITPTDTWEFKATFPAPGDEGLRFSRSELVEVRVR
jgi:hypothetical protein